MSVPRRPARQAARPTDPTPNSTDVVVAPGLSVHVFGKRVGIYSDRLDPGRGFVEMPLRDFVTLVSFFAAKLDGELLLAPATRKEEKE